MDELCKRRSSAGSWKGEERLEAAKQKLGQEMEHAKMCTWVDADDRSRYSPSRIERKNGRSNFLRWVFSAVLLASIMLQGGTWSIVEAEPLHSDTIMYDEDGIREWLTDRLGMREDMFTFRYNGETETLTKQLSQALEQAVYSDPFIRYNVSRYSLHWKGADDYALVTVYVSYRETYEQYQYVRQEAKRIVKDLMPAKMNEVDTVKWLHDYVVKHVAYDESMNSFTTYDALVKGTTVCQGYALLLQMLLEEAGIPSIVVEGQAGGVLHAWNMVQVDDQWYHVDATWDDPVPNKPNEVRHSYFMLSDLEMKIDHEWDMLKTPPADQIYIP
ncbi:transglutaminase domain-containing protein [Paenibacillus marinisediminis]